MKMSADGNEAIPRAVTFDVTFDSPVKTRPAKCPHRFQQKQPKNAQPDAEMDGEEDLERALRIQEKLLKAAKRKEEQEAAKLLRIQQRQEQCRHMASKMGKLLAQDAKRQGVAGTENIRPMSRREAGALIQSVHRDFQRLGAELDENLGT